MSDSIYDIQVTRLDGTDYSLRDYEGKVLLIVNTASKCGFTPQYTGLEALHEKFKEQGLVVLGFPCNQFGRQEPGSAADIQTFCSVDYPVSFSIHEKLEVNGQGAHPLYKKVASDARGLLGTKMVKWNFTKFLVDRSGTVTGRFAPRTTPAELEREIQALL